MDPSLTICTLCEPRRHIQIKSVDGQTWEASLRLQFSNERKLHPQAKLELCVRQRRCYPDGLPSVLSDLTRHLKIAEH
jgi:hypothetical protein